MKPVRLTMQAFGPYHGREIVDFRDAVEAGLFGIYGQTGSGKSTIFSAMTFALFGEAAKAEQDTTSLRSDSADADRATEVEFVFDIADRRYVVRRRPEQARPKQRGSGVTKDAHEAWLFDATGMALDDITPERSGKIIAEKKTGLVGRAIEDLLGYGADQFRQIVLLPQGRFEAFLAADTKARLGILRDLFDVSLYRQLAAQMKADAESVERDFRAKRDVFYQRLNSEGFESPDALKSGITEAENARDLAAEAEGKQRAAHKESLQVLDAARAVDRLFDTASQATAAVNALRDKDEVIRATEAKLHAAEKARSLLDVESHAKEAAKELSEAEGALGTASAKLNEATDNQIEAQSAHEAEEAKAGEIEQFKRDIATMERHEVILGRSAAISQNLTGLRTKFNAAQAAVQKCQSGINTCNELRDRQQNELTTARKVATARQELQVKLPRLETAINHAVTLQKTQAAFAASLKQVDAFSASHQASVKTVNDAKAAFVKAEQELSQAQALQLAHHLKDGEACPVCGALDHPAPATGSAHHAGLDATLKLAKQNWESCQAAEREAHTQLVAAQGLLQERQKQLAELAPAERDLAELRAEQEQLTTALKNLGPLVDIAAAEAKLAATEKLLKDAAQELETLRSTTQNTQTDLTTEQTRLDEIQSGIPPEFRDLAQLSAAHEKLRMQLTQRETNRLRLAEAANTAREAKIATAAARENARKNMETSQGRQERTRDAFAKRLEEAQLTNEAYQSLKPAIATIETDRQIVKQHHDELLLAEEHNRKSRDAIASLERPMLEPLETNATLAEDMLQAAQNASANATARLEQLKKLSSELADTMRKLEKAEAESGPLRELAALFNSKNAHNLDLETFAIGAMFDQVLLAANQRLSPMSGERYRLERATEGGGRGRRGLDIHVHDTYTGKPRPTTTLSGGESFIAALSLALGLADVVESANGKVRLDTIFIDEGFGSLDTENGTGTLDQVLQALSTLVSQNRAVGLISHVPLVQEAIPNGFYIRKDMSGSHVEQRGLQSLT